MLFCRLSPSPSAGDNSKSFYFGESRARKKVLFSPSPFFSLSLDCCDVRKFDIAVKS